MDWKSTLLSVKSNLRQAADVLTNSSMRIVLIIDEDERLQGTITDGDIRRALIKGKALESTVKDVMERNPVTVILGQDKQSIVLLMREKDLLQLPVLDRENRVVGLEVMQDLIYGVERNNPVLLMAGGFGKRLLPLTHDLPKPLLKVGRKPILESIIEQLAATGLSRIFIAIHYKADLISQYFGDGKAWGVDITYLEESEPYGTAGALALLKPQFLTNSLLVMNGDLLTRLDFGRLLEFHESHNGGTTMCVREYELQVPYGVVENDGEKALRLVEKPIQTYSVNAGIYVFEPEVILERFRRLTHRDMPDLLSQIMDSGETVNVFPIHEYWLDIGRIEEYERAQIEGAKSISRVTE